MIMNSNFNYLKKNKKRISKSFVVSSLLFSSVYYFFSFGDKGTFNFMDLGRRTSSTSLHQKEIKEAKENNKLLVESYKDVLLL